MKKLVAGFLTALMTAMAFASVVLGVPLSEYPYGEVPIVVVGAAAKTEDVVGAVDLAVRLAEIDIVRTPVEVPGIPPEIDGYEFLSDIRSTDQASGWVDKATYTKLLRETVVDSAGVEHYVLEQISAEVNFPVNVTEAFLDVDVGEVKYKISYTPSMPEGEKVLILGKEYEIIDVATGELKLGETKQTAKLSVGESDSIGPYEISVYGVTLAGELKLTVLKAGTAIAGPTFAAVGDSAWLDENKLKLEVVDIFVGYEAVEAWIILKLVHVNTIVTLGADSPFDDTYTVSGLTNDTAGLLSLELANKLDTVPTVAAEDQIPYIKPDEVFKGPAEYFLLTFKGLTTEDTETISYDKEGLVKFADANKLDMAVSVVKLKAAGTYNVTDLAKDDVLGISDYAVFVEDVGTDWVKLTHRAWSLNITTDGTYDTGYGFSIVTITSGGVLAVDGTTGQLATDLGALITPTGVVQEALGTITVNYNATLKNYESVSIAEFTLEAENARGLTNYGSLVTLGAARETVTIVYPDEQIKANAILGEVAPAELVEVYKEEIRPIRVSIAMLDTEITDLAALDKNVIAVGGPCVNLVSAQAYGFTELTCGAPAAEAVGITEGQAKIEVFEDIITGKYLVVVVGYSALDTRVASAALQRYDELLTAEAIGNVTAAIVTGTIGAPVVTAV